MSSIQGSELWNEGLKLVSYCPVCETRYNPMEAQLLGQDGETHLLHVQCRTCHNSILALVLVNPSGASSVGLLTDLSYEDVMRFRGNGSVTVNDVIDTHKHLEDWGLEEFLGKQQVDRLKKRARKQRTKKTQ
ncbi:hypothetical protein CO174_01960 [Candidatus Uhrbacteria bacterium CG_4_9_14_3_um_filter_50_9]|uniref:Uncharacterized protein n=1 Tax=Candidatus Uhrbacteria bacterium CG_4_9_14_3_um_filter_50_9 TaxID=1975035 RepID=A0A2M7XCR4_9BACT|nr:MAG: hypothetical protein CO174_01960 [Candidatus Uhrbacteria bacterium CG_4_9_14_3_um_filter_50_9]